MYALILCQWWQAMTVQCTATTVTRAQGVWSWDGACWASGELGESYAIHIADKVSLSVFEHTPAHPQWQGRSSPFPQTLPLPTPSKPSSPNIYARLAPYQPLLFSL